MTTSPPPSSPLLEPAVAPEDEGLPLSALCPICYRRPPIYTCPACYARSCSVTCVKKHKSNRLCSGVRDPTKYVKRSKLMTETGVNRDFNFLTGLEKTITRATEVLPGLVEDGGRKGEGEGDGEEAKRGKRVKMSREAKVHFHQLLKERGTEVKWAPWEGFERAKENFTRVNKNSKKILWTVEWILVDQENRRIRDHDIPDAATLNDAVHMSTVLPEEIRKQKGLKYFLVLQSPANIKRCTLLEKTETIREALRMQSVLEYPDIMISTQENPDGWELISKKIVEIKEREEKKPGNRGGNKRKRQHNKGMALIQDVAQHPTTTEEEAGAMEQNKANSEARPSEAESFPPQPQDDEKPSSVGIEVLEGASEVPPEPPAKKSRTE